MDLTIDRLLIQELWIVLQPWTSSYGNGLPPASDQYSKLIDLSSFPSETVIYMIIKSPSSLGLKGV